MPGVGSWLGREARAARVALLALLLGLVAACEARPVAGGGPGLHIGGSIGAFGAHSR